MKVNLFNCARKKWNKAVLLSGLGLGIGVGGEAEASTTYSGTLTADSPSYAAFPSLLYNVYTFKGDGTSRSFSINDNVSDNSSVYVYLYTGNFDPLNKESNKSVKYDGQSVSGTDQYYIVVAASLNKS